MDHQVKELNHLENENLILKCFCDEMKQDIIDNDKF
jgi:hypothetical protein